MKNLKHTLVALTLFLACVFSEKAIAQLQSPAASPAASVSQVVGFTKITIDYSSPAVKGRKVWGDLVPYGASWRAGANAATTVEFSTGVSIAGTNVRPGKYSLFITPQQSGDWTIHLNSKGNSVFTYMKDDKIDEEALAKDDAVAIKVTPKMVNDSMERLMFSISPENNKVGKVHFGWDKVRLSFDVDTQVDQKLENLKNTFN